MLNSQYASIYLNIRMMNTNDTLIIINFKIAQFSQEYLSKFNITTAKINHNITAK